jgi:hypothetical protein
LQCGQQINAVALLDATEFFVALNKIAAPSCSPREDQSLLMRNLKRLKSSQPFETKLVIKLFSAVKILEEPNLRDSAILL